MTRLSKDIKVGNSNTTLESLVPYVLYQNDSGSLGDITLLDTANNYFKIDIIVWTPYNLDWQIFTIYEPNGKTTNLFFTEGMSNDIGYYTMYRKIYINNNKITTYNNTYGIWGTNGYTIKENRLRIVKVIGYK